VQLVWRESAALFRARNPFPVGNVVEDPATGAAAAALGAYLRWRGDLAPPATFTILQGVEMGRPSRIEVEVPDATGGIRVSGTAVTLDGAGGAPAA
jgi:PhzF family phenazine biosynthesis protein